MNKKVVSIITAAGILFAGAGTYTILADSSGYDSYKEAMKKTHTLKNATTEMEMSIFDNDKLLLETDTAMKYDMKRNAAMAVVEVKTNKEELQLNGYLHDGKAIIKPAGTETYFVPDAKHPKMNKDKGKFHDPEMMKLGELVIDAITQPIQDNFEQNNNTIIIDMKKEDFPNLIHSIGKQVIKMGFKAHGDIQLTPEEYPFLTDTLTTELPKIQKDITIEKAYVKVTLSKEGYIEAQEAVFNIKGKEENGTFHDLVVKVNLSVKDVNKTSIDQVNLEGKNVQTFKMKKVH